MYSDLIQNQALYGYLKKFKYPFSKSGKTLMVQCPFCKEMSAHKVPYAAKFKCHNPVCEMDNKFTLTYLVKHHQPKFKDSSTEDVLQFLKDEFNVDVTTDKDLEKIQKQFDFFSSLGWSLIPVEKPGKFARCFGKMPYEAAWQKSTYKQQAVWESWYASGLNVGLLCGEESCTLSVDVDLLSNEEAQKLAYAYLAEDTKTIEEIQSKKLVPENLKKLLGNTLVQETFKGYHFFYEYDNEIPKTSFNFENIHLDVESAGGQVVISPSRVEIKDVEKSKTENKNVGTGYLAPRTFINNLKPIKVPAELKEFILSNCKSKSKSDQKTELSDLLNDSRFTEIFNSDFKIKSYQDGEGRNQLLLSLLGVIRKQFSLKETAKVMNIINNTFFNPPLPVHELEAMCGSISTYQNLDVENWKTKISDYIEDVEETTRNEIKQGLALGDKKEYPNIERAIKELFDEEKLRVKGNKLIVNKSIQWTDCLLNQATPIDFKYPFFHDVAYINYGDLILIGAPSGRGKTTLAMNIIRGLVEQGIKPYYISTESGSRYLETALKLGMREGSFFHPNPQKQGIINPYEIKFEKKAISIFDWIDPGSLGDSGFARVNTLITQILNKTIRVQGVTLIFMQLRKDERWFAQDLVDNYPAVATRFLHEKDDSQKIIRTKPYFDFDPYLSKVRDRKIKGDIPNILLEFDWRNMELTKRGG